MDKKYIVSSQTCITQIVSNVFLIEKVINRIFRDFWYTKLFEFLEIFGLSKVITYQIWFSF